MVRRPRRAQPGRRKKLSGAGRWWAGARSIKDHTEEDAKAWGIQRSKPRAPAPETYGVWEEHWPALELFLAMRTQWRVVAGMGGAQHQGIDYTALYGHPKFARLGFDEQDALLAQVQHIEAGALDALNEHRALAQQEAEEQQRITQAIEDRAELGYRLECQQRTNVQELMNVQHLPVGHGDGAFVA